VQIGETCRFLALRAGAAFGGLFTIRRKIPRWQYILLALIPVVLVLGLWQGLTSGAPEERVVSINILPSPREVLAAIPPLWSGKWRWDPPAEEVPQGTAPRGHWEREPFIYQVGRSARRILLSFAIACALALPVGFAMGAFERVRGFFHPVVLAGGYLPIPALIPLTMSFFGTGESQKVVFLVIAFLIFLTPQVVLSVDKVDSIYLQTAYTLGASTWQAFTRVLVSIAWEDVYRAMRYAFGVGWSYILLVEMVIIEGGLGDVVLTAERRGPRANIYIALAAIVLIAFLTDKLWELGGRRLFPHRVAS
jgi:ABC-type nitrate/sulfonate/bicarbonate transport system permease component